jgi:membrane-associated phospholipid phosphatase
MMSRARTRDVAGAMGLRQERTRRTWALAVALALLSIPSEAQATDPDRVEWSPDWPRVRLWEAVAAVALAIGDTEIEERVPLPGSATWRGGILFDDWARGVFRGRTVSAQSTASTVSDALFKVGSLVPFIIDLYFATLSVHQNADVALQMLVIDLESFGISGLISLTGEHGVGRSRPYTEDCGLRDASGNLLHTCGTGNDNRSFFSGHAAATATAAGLTCVHHQHFPLFGGGVADLAPCLVMIGVSAATGILRLVYDEHWASDVVVGWTVGALSGYVLPSVLHYGFGSGRRAGAIRSGSVDMVPTLMPYRGGAGVGMVGVF